MLLAPGVTCQQAILKADNVRKRTDFESAIFLPGHSERVSRSQHVRPAPGSGSGMAMVRACGRGLDDLGTSGTVLCKEG
jgi:hypothetical protein